MVDYGVKCRVQPGGRRLQRPHSRQCSKKYVRRSTGTSVCLTDSVTICLLSLLVFCLHPILAQSPHHAHHPNCTPSAASHPAAAIIMLTRQLHATARRAHSTGPAQHATELPAKNIYRDFSPCTLHYYSCHGPTMAMHATSSSPSSDDDKVDNRLGQDVVRVQEDGLVYPGPEGTDSVWNGAMLMPLATFLLDITENYHDVYEEQKAAGHYLPEPYFFTVPKGGLCLNLAAGGRLANLSLASQDYGYPVLFFWLTNMGRCSTLCPA